MENEKLISHIEKHLRHIEDRKTGGFEWDKNNAEVYRIALAALNSEHQRSLGHRGFLLLSADQVQREYAEALGCAGDNESILEATGKFTKKQLIEEAKQSIKACHTIMRVSPNIDAHKISLRLAEIALASLDAEPVFFITVEGDDWIQAGRIPGSEFDFNNLPDGVVNLYAAPPAPVVAWSDEQIEGFDGQ
ncbi:hypothetical protein [Citrobacter koseri]|uniref:hypothetical protein n=1 Tax=Citrobacter koseri TaxID=545 RepID=UPI00330F95F5|nr:hypothetical protein [Citrobacter koseri]